MYMISEKFDILIILKILKPKNLHFCNFFMYCKTYILNFNYFKKEQISEVNPLVI